MREPARTWVLAILLALSLCGASAHAAGSLTLTGSLIEQRAWSAAELGQLPQTEIVVSHAVDSRHSQEAGKTVYRGILLRDLLQASGLHEKTRHDFRRMLIVARASDGYIALFTWAELFNAKAGDSVLVMVDKGVQPEPQPSLTLRSLADIRPGPRHVKWLEQIEVMKITN